MIGQRQASRRQASSQDRVADFAQGLKRPQPQVLKVALWLTLSQGLPIFALGKIQRTF